jgi:protein required for attachment to host cells
VDKMTATTWIVVADSSAARIFGADEPTGPIKELEAMTHPEGRMLARELTSDLPGRAFDSAGQGRHTMESEVGPRQQAAIDFANFLAKRLEKARVQGEADRVVLVSPPDFLGLMRKSMAEQTRRLVVLELGRNFVRLSPKEIRERLPERLYEAPFARP